MIAENYRTTGGLIAPAEYVIMTFLKITAKQVALQRRRKSLAIHQEKKGTLALLKDLTIFK